MVGSYSKSAKKHEKGIALVFSLVMLSLLLILALSFALDSMFFQKAAYNSANASSSGFLAQSQSKQVLLLMRNDQANFDSDGRLYSKDITYGSASPIEHTDMLADRLPVSGILNRTDDFWSESPLRVNWNYIRAADGHIIGRAAFVAVNDDKIPLDSLIDERAGTLAYPKNNESGDDETRIGKYVSEINVRAAIPVTAADLTTVMVDDMTAALNMEEDASVLPPRPGFDGGRYTSAGWSSYSSLFSAVNATGFTLSADNEADIEENLSLAVYQDKEAFRADTNDDEIIDSDEFYNRFNLARTDWSTSTTNLDDLAFIRTQILLTPAASTPCAPTAAMEPWDGNDSDTAGLPWLAAFGFASQAAGGGLDTSLNGNFSSVYERRCQIAANLKDYCDSDNRPTSDVDPLIASNPNWITTAIHPAFTGNERTPYINKIGFKVTARQGEDDKNTLPAISSNPVAIVMNTPPPSQLKTIVGKKDGGSDDDDYLVDASSEYLIDAGYLVDASYLVAQKGGGGGGGSGGGGGGEKYAVWATVGISPTVELINMYGGNWSETLTAAISGTVNISTTVAGNTIANGIPFDCSIDIYSTDWTTTGYSNFISVALPFENFNGQTDVKKIESRSITVNVTGFSITKVVLHNGTNAYDYTQTLSRNLTASLPLVFTGDNSEADGNAWFGFAAHDPRQNLHAADWKSLTPAVNADPAMVFSIIGSSPYRGAANAENSIVINRTEAPSIGNGTTADRETVTDPANGSISTAFIRNAPMESPWELGFIHRGARWQTINLKVYDTSKAFTAITVGSEQYIPGGGLYSAGDANILDQIKMTENAESPQKINLKSQRPEVFHALFKKIYLGCGIVRDNTLPVAALNHMTVQSMASGSPGAPLSATVIGDTGGHITDKYNTVANPDERRTRASVADELLPVTPAAYPDAAREELIGKIINLTKIGGKVDDFLIIILAQTIKDIGGTIYKYSADETQSGTLACTLGTFDAVINLTNPEQSIYFDEITAEQKIVVKGCRGDDGSIKITSFQYIE